MADENIKKIVIEQKDLPPINSDEGKYVVRFRVVSEDRNRVSHWSPQYLVEPKPLEIIDDEGITLQSSNGFLSVTWDTPITLRIPHYDIYVSWGQDVGDIDPDNPDYFATVSSSFVSIPIPQAASVAQVFIQTMTYPRKRLNYLTVAESSIFTL